MYCGKKLGRPVVYIFVSRLTLALLALIPVQTHAQQRTLDAATRSNIVKRIATLLDENYVYQETAEDMASQLKRKLADGSYDRFKKIPSFASQLTDDLGAVKRDRHLKVVPLREESEITSLETLAYSDDNLATEADRRLREELRYSNFHFQNVARMPGNIGYMKMRKFADPSKGAGAVVRGIMTFLANSKALVIDLRDNPGGHTQMAQLLSSYLFDKPTHLENSYTRRKGSTEEIWTHYVDGPVLDEIPVFILLSKKSFSAAESFAFQLRELKRATIVGEATLGGGHSVEYFDLRDLGVTIKIPYARYENAATGKDYEGIGVAPDIKVSAGDALNTACIAALEGFLETETKEGREYAIRFYLERYKGRLNPSVLDLDALNEYVGVFESRNDSFEVILKNGELVAVRDSGERLPLIPSTKDKFRMQDNDGDYSLYMGRNEEGKVFGAAINFIVGQENRGQRYRRRDG